MALPHLTPEQRAAALEKGALVRQKRAEIKHMLKTGNATLADVLEKAKSDPVIGKMKVTALLMSLPGIGKAKCASIMEQVGISESRRVAGLGTHQKKALLELFR